MLCENCWLDSYITIEMFWKKCYLGYIVVTYLRFTNKGTVCVERWCSVYKFLKQIACTIFNQMSDPSDHHLPYHWSRCGRFSLTLNSKLVFWALISVLLDMYWERKGLYRSLNHIEAEILEPVLEPFERIVYEAAYAIFLYRL